MYLPNQFRVDDPALLTKVIHEHPLALFITTADGAPTADHIPVEIEQDGDRFRLLGHVAKANPLLRHVPEGGEILAVFRSLDHYVTPMWYPSTATHGKMVPTWNYQAVHVRGTIHWHRDRDTLLGLVTRLTERHESSRPAVWSVSDAPPDYIESMLGAIVGFTVEVTAMVGKFKASQNRAAEDRAGVRLGLAADGLSADAIAALVRDPTP